jgi:hypothetical protein
MTSASLSCRQAAFAGWIGVGREDITPPIGIYARNWGAAQHEVAEGIHRPLTATALSLQAQPSAPPLLLVSFDLGWWRTAADEGSVRGALIESLALDPARVMVQNTHTHAGPSICRDDRDRPGGHLVAPYLEQVRDAVLRAAQTALSTCQPATLDWAQGRCDLARDRDLPDPDRPRVVCGFHPFAPADDTLLVGRVTTEAGQALATLVNYACHPVTLAWENRLISPDFVGALRETVESHTGQAPCLFLQGASGELAPREQYTADTAIADAHGRQLGYAVLSTLEGMLPPGVRLDYAGVTESGAPLATWQRVPHTPSSTLQAATVDVTLPLKALPTIAEIERQMQDCRDRVLFERLARKRHVREAVGDDESAHLPLWGWQVGDALFLGQPNEAYSAFQTALRQQFQETLVVLNLVNGPHCGYLPPAEKYDQDLYQVWQSPFASGCLERMIAAGERLIRQLLHER